MKRYKYLVGTLEPIDKLQWIILCYSRLTSVKDCWLIICLNAGNGRKSALLYMDAYIHTVTFFHPIHCKPYLAQRWNKSYEVKDKATWVNIFKSNFCIKVYMYVCSCHWLRWEIFTSWVKNKQTNNNLSDWFQFSKSFIGYVCCGVTDKKEKSSASVDTKTTSALFSNLCFCLCCCLIDEFKRIFF